MEGEGGQYIDSTDWDNVASVTKKFIEEKRKQVQVQIVYKYDSKAEEESDRLATVRMLYDEGFSD